jgi:predicted dithiol-disulfide oxidoreductase (DUF899 family)/uncharacterized protein YndB with AHSA1/START domain
MSEPAAGSREFTITRVLDASRDEVFRAWTEPDQAARWFGPVGCTTPRETVSMDVQPGGEWRATMIRDEDGEEYPIGGVYREVLAPERLVFTWGDPARLGEPEQSLITITLTDLGGKTEMVFHQTGLDSGDERTEVQQGWSSCLDRLAGHIVRGALPPVVPASVWEPALAQLRAQEKQATAARDALAAARRRLPMVEITGHYTFTSDGPAASLVDLFEGRRQLIVYHFMERADGQWCEGCCMFTDTIAGLEHLHARDTAMAVVSHNPWSRLGPLRARMGWKVPFYSCSGNSFNADCGAGEDFGLSVFLRDGDRVFRSYFTTGRGVETLGNHWTLLDLTPLGRQETWEDSPPGRRQSEPYTWWRLHDEY